MKCDECGDEVPFVEHIGKKQYCYHCYYQVKREQAKEHAVRLSPETRKVKNAYRRGMKPSEIAKMMHITAEEVYRRLNEGSNENDR